MREVAITGLGLVTPLGESPGVVLSRVEAGECAAAPPGRFDAGLFPCRLCAEVRGFSPDDLALDPKIIRLMNRDAQLAVAAARKAMEDARISAGKEYAPEDIALFGSTGLAGMDLEEAAPIIRHSAGAGGHLDMSRFGGVALKRIRPILSFKILSNMPVCFVSMAEGIQGPNAVYNPWEGQGARALARGISAIRRGEAPCALVGGCDVKTHELAFLSLWQQGVLDSWSDSGRGTIPAEGAVFLVLEDAERAARRGARLHALLAAHASRTAPGGSRRPEVYREIFQRLEARGTPMLLSGEDGSGEIQRDEEEALRAAHIEPAGVLRPKLQAGNLFAAAAFLQVALAAELARRRGGGVEVIAGCFGHGSEQAAFLLEALP